MRGRTWKQLQPRSRRRAWAAAALVLVAGVSCDKVKELTGQESAPVKPSPSPVQGKLLGRAWVGKIGTEPIQVKFTPKGNGVAAEVVYTQFGVPKVKEQAAVTISPQGVVRVKGVSHKRLGGIGKFELDDMQLKLTPDGATLKGSSRDAYNPKGIAVSVSNVATLAQVDPPLDLPRAEQALVDGKWEGLVGSKPAKLVVSRKGGTLSGKMTVGNATTAVSVQVTPAGQVALRALPKPTAAGLMTETWDGSFLSPDLARVGGAWSQVSKQGFIEQSTGDAFVLHDLRKTKTK